MFAAQKLLSECQSHRDCQLPVHHLLFGKDPCPGTSKYLHVDYKCKPSEFSSSPLIRPVLVTPFPNPNPSLSHCHHPLHLFILFVFFSSPHSAEHKRHVVCEGGEMILRCKPPRVLNIYAAVYGRSLGQTDTCPSHLTRPPPFGESTGYSVFSYGGTNR